MKTFDFGNGHVPAHRHQNANGELGGWVADSVTVGSNVYIGQHCRVWGQGTIIQDDVILRAVSRVSKGTVSGKGFIPDSFRQM